MGLVGSFLGILGFGIGIPFGILIGFYLFIYSQPTQHDIKEPVTRPLTELDSEALEEIMPELPLWIKQPDFERVDWLNSFLFNMWPFLDKAICKMIKDTAKPIFDEYIGKFQIESIEFENMSLGTIPPTIHGTNQTNC